MLVIVKFIIENVSYRKIYYGKCLLSSKLPWEMQCHCQVYCRKCKLSIKFNTANASYRQICYIKYKLSTNIM